MLVSGYLHSLYVLCSLEALVAIIPVRLPAHPALRALLVRLPEVRDAREAAVKWLLASVADPADALVLPNAL